MSSLYLIFAISLGFLTGGSILWLILGKQMKKIEDEKQSLSTKLQQAIAERAAAQTQAERIPALEQQLAALQTEKSDWLSKFAAMEQKKKAEEEKTTWAEKAKESLKEAFQALSSEALQKNIEQFVGRAKGELSHFSKQIEGDWNTQNEQFKQLVLPLQEKIQSLDKEIRELEQKREGAYQKVHQEVQMLSNLTSELHQTLQSPSGRGKWGQFQLKRIVELAGMHKHVHYEEEASTEGFRPDMVLYLPNHGILPIDAKLSLEYYEQALTANDPAVKARQLALHAKAIASQIQDLSRKQYWEAVREKYGSTPDFVVMFVPIEASLSAAFEQDKALLENALQRKVLITTPVTLLALLKAAAYGWQQVQVSENAKRIAEEGRELYQRFCKFYSHIHDLGSKIDSTVKSYNETLGSIETRLLPKARKLGELQESKETLDESQPIETTLHKPKTTFPTLSSQEISDK